MPDPKIRNTNRLTLKTTLISVIAAVVLFAIASSFEDDAHWQMTTNEAPAMNPARESGVGPVLRTISAAENCERSENELRRSVERARVCEFDDDCTLFDFGYPIQCLTSVAKSAITALRLDYRRYGTNCDFRVYYDCPTGDMEREAVCRNNRCEVELTTLDGLTEQTLDHLGIGR